MKSINILDFKYICYVEGKRKGVEKLFAKLLETKKLNAFCKKVEKKDIDFKKIYKEYVDAQEIKKLAVKS
ncbi:hypothetical protein [Listeria welshimeri]|uniref:hypothetical protein n=1 Tax=Listeria welshimeri TaxID=1643 RepID=UPI002B25F58B|nr:hypothetical protein [Listeria welshimeri]